MPKQSRWGVEAGMNPPKQYQMTKLKCQVKRKIPMTKGVVLAFKHLDFNCHLDFDIWVLVYGIATLRS